MTNEVGYQPEEPMVKAPVETDDWRAQEMYNLGPDAIMDELLGLSEEVRSVKAEWEGVRFELRRAQERLKLVQAQVLQAALDSTDSAISDQVKGKNAEERKRKADIYLVDHPTIQGLAGEVKDAERLEIDTRLAMEALLDRSKNIHQWARMFEAQVKLLSTVRMPEPTVIDLHPVAGRTSAEIGHLIAKAYREPFLADSLPEAADTRIIFDFVKTPESSVVYEDAQKWMEWYANPVGSPPVDTVELIERIVKMQKYVGEEPEPDGAQFASEIDELFPPDVQIPPSVARKLSKEEVDAVEAAIERYDIGEKADESLGPSL